MLEKELAATVAGAMVGWLFVLVYFRCTQIFRSYRLNVPTPKWLSPPNWLGFSRLASSPPGTPPGRLAGNVGGGVAGNLGGRVSKQSKWGKAQLASHAVQAIAKPKAIKVGTSTIAQRYGLGNSHQPTVNHDKRKGDTRHISVAKQAAPKWMEASEAEIEAATMIAPAHLHNDIHYDSFAIHVGGHDTHEILHYLKDQHAAGPDVMEYDSTGHAHAVETPAARKSFNSARKLSAAKAWTDTVAGDVMPSKGEKYSVKKSGKALAAVAVGSVPSVTPAADSPTPRRGKASLPSCNTRPRQPLQNGGTLLPDAEPEQILKYRPLTTKAAVPMRAGRAPPSASPPSGQADSANSTAEAPPPGRPGLPPPDSVAGEQPPLGSVMNADSVGAVASVHDGGVAPPAIAARAGSALPSGLFTDADNEMKEEKRQERKRQRKQAAFVAEEEAALAKKPTAVDWLMSIFGLDCAPDPKRRRVVTAGPAHLLEAYTGAKLQAVTARLAQEKERSSGALPSSSGAPPSSPDAEQATRPGGKTPMRCTPKDAFGAASSAAKAKVEAASERERVAEERGAQKAAILADERKKAEKGAQKAASEATDERYATYEQKVRARKVAEKEKAAEKEAAEREKAAAGADGGGGWLGLGLVAWGRAVLPLARWEPSRSPNVEVDPAAQRGPEATWRDTATARSAMSGMTTGRRFASPRGTPLFGRRLMPGDWRCGSPEKDTKLSLPPLFGSPASRRAQRILEQSRSRFDDDSLREKKALRWETRESFYPCKAYIEFIEEEEDLSPTRSPQLLQTTSPSC